MHICSSLIWYQKIALLMPKTTFALCSSAQNTDLDWLCIDSWMGRECSRKHLRSREKRGNLQKSKQAAGEQHSEPCTAPHVLLIQFLMVIAEDMERGLYPELILGDWVTASSTWYQKTQCRPCPKKRLFCLVVTIGKKASHMVITSPCQNTYSSLAGRTGTLPIRIMGQAAIFGSLDKY